MLTYSPSINEVLVAIMFVLGSLSLVFSRLERETRSIGAWGVSMMLLAIGYALLIQQGRTASVLSLSGEIALLGAVLALHQAIRRFDFEFAQTSRLPSVALAAAAAVALAYFTFVQPDAQARIVVFSLATVMLVSRAAAGATRFARARGQPSHWLFAGLAWGIVLIFLLRAVVAAMSEPHSAEYFINDHLHPIASFAAVMVIVGLTFVLMWGEIALLNTRLADLAMRDSLTGLLNHATILAECERELARGARHGHATAVAMLDIDHFKRVNDTYGHPAGDLVLCQLAETVRKALRAQDAAGRYGGEEFLLLLPQTDLATAAAVLDRLRTTVEAMPCAYGDMQFHITISAGVAAGAPAAESASALIEAADQAMYKAKASGRNRVIAAMAALPGDCP